MAEQVFEINLDFMSFAEFTFWLSAVLILHTYIGYPFLLVGFSIFASKKREKDENHLPCVSMLVSAFNEQECIAEKMENSLQLNYPADKLQIIIGSDASTDGTEDIVRKYTDPRFKLVPFKQRRGKALVLNDLVEAASGEILVFSDANTMYKPDAIHRLVAHFGDAKIGGVCGRLVLLSKNGHIDTEGEKLYWDFENYIKFLEGKVRTVFGANGAIYAIRKELYERLPTDKAVMDDFLIPLKIVMRGYDVVYEKDAVVWEHTSPSLQSEFARKARIGAANFNGIREILPLLSPRRGFVAFGLWSHKLIRWLVPFLLISILASNILLLGSTFYNITFGLQALFYALALLGWKAEKLRTKLSVLVYPYYFLVVNSALLVGFFRFLTKSQQAAWVRSDR
ncbi:glycosyltransferase family 2 protein [candidate division KSB1 bacterium]|nr:glycosyltransferase family 2 protein [candidate division KSB1 bacterium]